MGWGVDRFLSLASLRRRNNETTNLGPVKSGHCFGSGTS